MDNHQFTYISTHDGSPFKSDNLQPRLGPFLDFLLRHVAQRRLILGKFHLKVKGRFEVGLIEARKSSSGIAGFELSAEHVMKLVVPWH